MDEKEKKLSFIQKTHSNVTRRAYQTNKYKVTTSKAEINRIMKWERVVEEPAGVATVLCVAHF